GRLTADTHVVYDEGDIIGSTLPNLKSDPDDGGCGGFLAIIIVVIVAIVAWYALPELAAFLGGGTATFGSYVAAGAIIGAAASVVTQGLFIALGYQDEFSWKDVAAGAISGAFGGAARGFGQLAQSSEIASTVKYAKIAARASQVAAAASKQLISNGKITSWSSLAVAALGPVRGIGENGETVNLVDAVGAGSEGILGSAVDYISPWLGAAESFIRTGEVTPTDWANGIAGTLSNAINGNGLGETESFGSLQISDKQLITNLAVGGVLTAFDKQAGKDFLANTIGNEIGNFIGGRIVSATGLDTGARDAVRGFRQGVRDRELAALEAAQTFRPDNRVGLLVSSANDDDPMERINRQLMEEPTGAGATKADSGQLDSDELQTAIEEQELASDADRLKSQLVQANSAGKEIDSVVDKAGVLAHQEEGILSEEMLMRALYGDLDNGGYSLQPRGQDQREQVIALIKEYGAELKAEIRNSQAALEGTGFWGQLAIGFGGAADSTIELAKSIGGALLSGASAAKDLIVNVATGDLDAVQAQLDAAFEGIEGVYVDAKQFTETAATITQFIYNDPEISGLLFDTLKDVSGELSQEQFVVAAGALVFEGLLAVATGGAGVAAKGAKGAGTAGKLIEALGELAVGPGKIRGQIGAVGDISKVRALNNARLKFSTTDAVPVSGSRAIDLGQSYEVGVRGLYGDVPFSQRQYEALVDGKWVSGVADNVVTIGGKNTAIEAKFVDDWAASIRNPGSPNGARPWAVVEQQKMLDQATKYNAAFDNIIYHTNSTDLATYYSKVFTDAGINNFKFVITPATR
ncbi:hypothetical protein KQ940_22445, partial [Marinobacterium sp. D7]|uniref:hypothetical protein n=1 Tax=Marinobacterium ramblicola TaxID=2849041 RepID=UPI001C2DDD84